MTIADEKIKASSERFMLFKITPKKNIGQDLSLDSGVVYTMSQENRVETIKRNGVELTNVSNTNPSADEWYWDKDSKTLYVGLASAPNSTDNVVILFFNLYLTGEKTRYLQEDPVTPSGDVVEWEPKVERYPTLSQSVKNVISGVFSISSFSVKISDHDGFFKSILGVKTTLNNSDIKVWSCLNEEKTLNYIGKIKTVSFSGEVMSLKINDNFSRLKDSATMGVTPIDRYAYADPSFYSDVDPKRARDPIPKFFGKYSYAKIVFGRHGADNSLGSLYLNDGNEGINIDYSPFRSTSVNNIFILGRVGPNGIKDQDLGTITSVDHLPGTITQFGPIIYTTGHFMRIGDCFKVVAPSGREYFCRVSSVNDTSVTCWTIGTSLLFADPVSDRITPGSNYTTGKSIQTTIYRSADTDEGITENDTIAIGFDQTAGYYLEETLPNGEKLIKIDISKEGGKPYTQGFEPNLDRLVFSMSLADEYPHQKVIKEMVEASGLTVDASSFTQAGIDLSADCFFQIPLLGSKKIEPYQKYIERILQSVVGILYTAEDLSVGYKILNEPTSAEEISDDTAKFNSAKIEYNDIITSLRLLNRHTDNKSNSYNNETEEPSALLTDQESKFLNGQELIKEIEHVMSDTTWATRLLSVLSKRFLTYSFDVASELIDSSMGDDITYKSEKVIGGSSTNLSVNVLKKSPSKITAQAIDLEGL